MPADSANRSDIRQRLGLRPIINVSGTMTALGASIVVPEAVRAVADILPEFVEITDLQRKASTAIARATGTEAGFVTASASAGITLSVAGCMTGADLGRIEQLPDATGMKSEVVIQLGHMVGYGAPVEQAIRLAGVREGQRVLDVACGTGRASVGLAQAVGPAGRLDALDLTGWNYMRRYATYRQRNPDKPIIYSESASALCPRGFYELPLPQRPPRGRQRSPRTSAFPNHLFPAGFPGSIPNAPYRRCSSLTPGSRNSAPSLQSQMCAGDWTRCCQSGRALR